MRLRNTSGIDDALARQIIEWIRADLGIAGFDAELRKGSASIAGRAYIRGSHYHATARPFIVCRIGLETVRRVTYQTADGKNTYTGLTRSLLKLPQFAGLQRVVKLSPGFPCKITPYQYAHLKDKRYVLANRIEALVYVAAHEMRHLWQQARWTERGRCSKTPYFYGAKGKFSEIDTESYAIRTLRRWRREQAQ